MDELYKKLQPAPSPQQFNYLNQFEGQELTITKQLNLAYQEPTSDSPGPGQSGGMPPGGGPVGQGGPPTSSAPDPLAPIPSPMGSQAGTTGGPHSVSGSVASPMPAGGSTSGAGQTGNNPPTSSANTSNSGNTTPSTSQPTTTPGTGSTSNQTGNNTGSGNQPSLSSSTSSSGAPTQQTNTLSQQNNPGAPPGGQLGSAPPGGQLGSAPPGGQLGSAPPGGNLGSRLTHYDPPSSGANAPSKSSLTNITSASLANLAKGVEHLSNQMQQNMLQGGPFHNIQIQGQMSDIEGGGPGAGLGKEPTNGPLSPSAAGALAQPGTPQQSSSQVPPNQQPSVNNTYVNANLSIQQLNIQSVNQPGPGANPQMQIQQMSNEMNLPPGANGPMGASMSQQQSQMMFNGPGPQGPPGQPMDPMAQAKMDPMAGYGPGGMPPRGFATGPPSSGPSPGIPSPNYRGNANVQVQAKAPNTIQYLPANPPSSQPGGS